MQQTTVQLIFENWKNLSKTEFDEFMLNQEKTLLREEKQEILDAYCSCVSRNPYSGEFVVNVKDYESANVYWNFVYEKQIEQIKPTQQKLF